MKYKIINPVAHQSDDPDVMCVCVSLSEGSNLTPAHHYPDFRFKTYAPVAFRYFRELFGIRPDDYLVRHSTDHTGSHSLITVCVISDLYAQEVFSILTILSYYPLTKTIGLFLWLLDYCRKWALYDSYMFCLSW